MIVSHKRPKRCCHPDCFNCPYKDCRWSGDDKNYYYNHSDKGKMRFERYDHSDKGKARFEKYNQSEKGRLNQQKKSKKKVASGKNAEYCRRYYEKKKMETVSDA